MINKKYAAVCGTYCGHCVLLRKQRKGCGYVDGKPFNKRIPGEKLARLVWGLGDIKE